MAVPFGFSVGDFIAVIEVIGTVIKSLEDSRGSAAEYRGVITELDSLRTALEHVRDVETDDDFQKTALEKVSDQCAGTMVDFLSKIIKYQPTLRDGGSGRRWKDCVKKIQWSLYSKEDVRTFQAQVQGHTASIQIILAKIQMTNANVAVCHNSAALIRIESKLDQQRMLHILVIRALARCFSDLRAVMASILFYNLHIFNIITSVVRVSPQLEFGKPVIFEDAHGRMFPIHLQWIDSWEDFEDMLKIKFRKVPGLRKIESGQYALQDRWGSSDLVRSQPFQSCFRPGRRVDMSVIFYQTFDSRGSCPKCKAANAFHLGEEINCFGCGLWYRVTEVEVAELNPAKRRSTGIILSSTESKPRPPRSPPKAEIIERVSDFSRVRIEDPKIHRKLSSIRPGMADVQSSMDTSMRDELREATRDFLDTHEHVVAEEHECVVSEEAMLEVERHFKAEMKLRDSQLPRDEQKIYNRPPGQESYDQLELTKYMAAEAKGLQDEDQRRKQAYRLKSAEEQANSKTHRDLSTRRKAVRAGVPIAAAGAAGAALHSLYRQHKRRNNQDQEQHQDQGTSGSYNLPSNPTRLDHSMHHASMVHSGGGEREAPWRLEEHGEDLLRRQTFIDSPSLGDSVLVRSMDPNRPGIDHDPSNATARDGGPPSRNLFPPSNPSDPVKTEIDPKADTDWDAVPGNTDEGRRVDSDSGMDDADDDMEPENEADLLDGDDYDSEIEDVDNEDQDSRIGQDDGSDWDLQNDRRRAKSPGYNTLRAGNTPPYPPPSVVHETFRPYDGETMYPPLVVHQGVSSDTETNTELGDSTQPENLEYARTSFTSRLIKALRTHAQEEKSATPPEGYDLKEYLSSVL